MYFDWRSTSVPSPFMDIRVSLNLSLRAEPSLLRNPNAKRTGSVREIEETA